MAHFCRSNSTDVIYSLPLDWPSTTQIGLWGGDGEGGDLEIRVTGPEIVKVKFLRKSSIAHHRIFEITGIHAGNTTLRAFVRTSGAPYTAPLEVSVGRRNSDDLDQLGLSQFYHGTSLEQAKKLITIELVPRSVTETQLLDVNEFTDFGKGFYTHPQDSKSKAVEWAKRRHTDWGVVRFGLTASEVTEITTSRAPLHFRDKFNSRPSDAPIIFNSQRASWIEFVEFNRHVRKPVVQRPKDNDWTADYGWIIGPIWGRKDSGLPGAPGLPEVYHQINWGLAGMQVLNTVAAMRRRVLFSKHNEHLL